MSAALLANSVFLLMRTDAEAIPAFARKYDMDCSHCHSMAPKLNRVGLKFHDNFTLKEALGDLDPELRDRVRNEDPEDMHPAYWPVSFRIAGGYQYNKRDNQPVDSAGLDLRTISTNTFALERFELLAGGLFAPGISYYISYYPEALNVGLPGQPPVHAHPGATSGSSQLGALGFAWARFADIFGQTAQDEHHDAAADGHDHEAAEPKHDHGQDLILGSHELHLTLSGHHRLTNAPYLAYRYDPLYVLDPAKGFKLDAPQLGASLDGSTPWFGYAVSLYNGTSNSADDNRTLDVFATINQDFGDNRVGVFGLRGTSPTSWIMTTTTSPPSPVPGTGSANKPYFRFGADTDLNVGPLNVLFFALYGQVDKDLFDPSLGQTAKFYAGFLETDYLIESVRTMLIARYDGVRNVSQGLSTYAHNRGDTDAFTLAVRRDLVLTSRANLQVHVEANATRVQAIATNDNDQTSNTFFAGVDWSF
ncbi:MAG TPA: hypothetical protein VFN94_06210 [Nitrospiria bacterium]|nr:hypothetical protein [Nitrospiria bacterium]